MQKILQDEPFAYNEGILHHVEGVDIIPTNIELSGMEISLVNALAAADSVIVPVQAQYFPLNGMIQLMKTICKSVRCKDNSIQS